MAKVIGLSVRPPNITHAHTKNGMILLIFDPVIKTKQMKKDKEHL